MWVAGFAPCALAQEREAFAPDEHLAGYAEAALGEDSDLYRFAEFEALDGKVLSTAELKEALQKWEVERARVTVELERLKGDPAGRSRRRLGRKLAAHPYFSKIELVECVDFPPLHFLVQAPPKAQAGFEKPIVKSLAPWFLEAIASFEEEFADVLPERREGHAILAIAVLASPGDYTNFWQVTPTWDASNGGSHHADARLAVVHLDAFGSRRTEAEARSAALYAVMRGELAAFVPADSPPTSLWLSEGLASAYSAHSGTAEQPQIPVCDVEAMVELARAFRDEKLRRLVPPIADLLALKDWDALMRWVETRGGAPNRDTRGWAAHLFRIESGLLAWFLLREEDGRRKPQLERELARHCGTTDRVERAVPPLDPAELQREFVRFLAREVAKARPSEALPAELAKQLETAAATPVEPATAAAPPGGGTPPALASRVLDASFRPDALLELPFPPDARLGTALLRAGEGELAAAIAECEAVHGITPPGDPLGERAAREIARLRDLAALRRDVLERARTSGKRIRLEAAGAAPIGVQELDGEVVVVSDGRGQLTRLPLAAIGCEELLRRMSDLKLELGKPETRACAALLAGRKAWSKGLGSSSAEAALREDGERSPALLQTARAARRIESLARAPVPASADAGESVLEAIRSLLVEHGKEPLVIARAGLLRAFAAHALAAQFETRGLGSLGLRGKAEPLGEGRLRITWDFEQADQAQDWIEAPFPSDGWKQRIVATEKESFIRIEDGVARCHGRKFRHTKLELEAPMSVRATFRYEAPNVPDGADFPFVSIGVTLCDDGRGQRVRSIDMAGIEVLDRHDYRIANEPTNFDFERVYAIRVEHDGKTATLSSEGLPARSVPVFGRTRGHVGIVIFGDVTVEILDLTVEGRLAPASRIPLRDAWLEQELAAFDAATKPRR